MRAARRSWAVAGLCVLGAWLAADDAAAAYQLSRGRSLLLNKWGLQVQGLAFAYATPGISNHALWQSSKFTTIDSWMHDCTAWLGGSPAGTPWARWVDSGIGVGVDPLIGYEQPYKNNLVSLQWGDEETSTMSKLTYLKDLYNGWRAMYPNVLAHTNFLHYSEVGGTVSGLNTYMQAAKPDMLCFDAYPEYTGSKVNTSRTQWYDRMSGYRSVATAGYGTGPIPYAQYMRIYRTGYGAAPPDESFIHMQYNANLAFGFTNIKAFVYNDPTWDPGVYPAIFDSPGDNAPNATFYQVAEANRESRNLGPALVRLVSTDIRMIGGTISNHRPSTVDAWSPGAGGNSYIVGITPWNPGTGTPDSTYHDVVIGYFAPLLASNPNHTFVETSPFMVVNGSAGGSASALAQTYRINFNFTGTNYNALVRLDRGTGHVVPVSLAHDGGSLYHYDLTLEGGDGDLFGFWNSSSPLPTIPEPGSLALLGIGLSTTLVFMWRRRCARCEQ